MVDMLPGCGDNAYADILRISKHVYRIVNYSSPWEDIDGFKSCSDWSWIRGQISPKGTFIYYLDITFEPISFSPSTTPKLTTEVYSTTSNSVRFLGLLFLPLQLFLGYILNIEI